MAQHVRRFFITISLLLVTSFVALTLFLPRPITADIYPSEQIIVDGITRQYRIVVPHSRLNPSPIIFAFHGIGDSAESMAHYSQLDDVASRNRVILVYPEALKSMWATVDASSDNFETNPDIRYFDQLLGRLSGRLNIDQNRVYAAGMSNGATFVHVLAAARSNNLAAIVAHSGSKPRDIVSPATRLPIMLIVGAKDGVVSAMESDADQYRSEGHLVEYICIPGLSHEWSTQHNPEIWNFLTKHTLNRTQ